MMHLLDKILGRPLPSRARKKVELTIWTGVPLLGLDAFASTAYGPEAALMILLPLGAVGLHYFFLIMLAVVFTLFSLYLSYQQTTEAYPNGGGAYIVASDNFGKPVGLWAAISLMLDYLLNVAVGISAGVGAIVSALPMLQPYTLWLCLFVLFMLTILNLRGVRETGLVFIFPTLAFVACIVISITLGLLGTGATEGHVSSIMPPPPPGLSNTISTWLLLGAFANGLTAMTGVEAVNNAVPLFRKPTVRNAQWTLTIIVGVLALFLLALGYLCPLYHLTAMDETRPGYQTILSQLVAAVAGKGLFYYFSMISIFIVLAYSAQTSFAGFPRVCRLLAEDDFLPHFFADRGRRLVYSHGIVVLALLSGALLIIFGGSTYKLIPLFAVGAFSAFLFSQAGMVVYWLRKKDSKNRLKLGFNALGAIITALALIIIIAEKFTEGAWIIIVIAPILALLFLQINRHYKKIARKIEEPLKLQVSKLKPPVVIIPVQGWNRVSESAIQFGLLLSNDLTALYISIEQEDEIQQLKELWNEKVEKPARKAKVAVPRLEIINSPYRKIYKPILDFVKKVKRTHPDRLIAVIIPELVEAHWYEYLLHNVRATILRAFLFFERSRRTVVITTPWYLFEKKKKKNSDQ